MDLGCLDMGCISVSDKHSDENFTDSSNKDSDRDDPVSANSRVGKSKSPKGNNQSTWNALNKCTAQIKKPRHRNSSPLNWFPRKKVDSYLKRKIKMLQEVDGMNLTLDETLGDTNPHYCRVLREKMAAREAAHKAMDARKATLVEASWCRILKAARIQSKEAEDLLLKSEKAAAEAFEAAGAIGVIMYDKPNCPQTHYQIETSANGGGSTTHKIIASFDTAFEVDREVAAAVKTAFVRLANCAPFSKDEFKDLLHKICENPDTGDSNQELPEFSSECESESGSELEMESKKNDFGSQNLDAKEPVLGMMQSKSKRRLSSEKVNRANLIEMMLERLKCLQEDELSSLATIVATCGLNAALAEVENSKMHPNSATDLPSTSVPNSRRTSSLGAGTMRTANLEYYMNGSVRRKQIESEFPSLDKFLVKHMSKLEREVQEAKNSRISKSSKAIGGENPIENSEDGEVKVDSEIVQSESTSELGCDLLKHSSKFIKEIEEAKKKPGNNFEIVCKNSEAGGVPNVERTYSKKDVPEIPSLDKFLVKHVSRLEREVQEAKSRENDDSIGEAKKNSGNVESISKNPEAGAMPNVAANHKEVDASEVPSLDKFLVKRVSRLEREVQEAKSRRNNDSFGEAKKNSGNNFETISKNSEAGAMPNEAATHRKVDAPEVPSLDKFLVKRVSRLEREVQEAKSRRYNDSIGEANKNSGNNSDTVSKKQETGAKPNEVAATHKKAAAPEVPSLDKFLVKHVSRLEKEVQEAKSRRNNDPVEGGRAAELNKKNGISSFSREVVDGKENRDLNKEDDRFSEIENKDTTAGNEETIDSLDKILVKPVHRLEREKMEAGKNYRNHRHSAAWIKAEEEERRHAMEGL
ncbi:Myosin-2 heavy chain-like protein [Citrus sinensis]|uniref:Myosin-2 heavy chain-like protein n=1 Tax=Citrus sinensis TaxID=2711 RepID=A0ACB8IEN3_CITSI|nr:Myosin-2 heavy chain-like protein [Citrus sinensis]